VAGVEVFDRRSILPARRCWRGGEIVWLNDRCWRPVALRWRQRSGMAALFRLRTWRLVRFGRICGGAMRQAGDLPRLAGRDVAAFASQICRRRPWRSHRPAGEARADQRLDGRLRAEDMLNQAADEIGHAPIISR
jgi:hypothetical protein